MAKRGRECEDAWGGFDGQETVYDPKEERSYESLVWKYIIGIALIALAAVIFLHSKEMKIINNGTCIVASYELDDYGNEVAWYTDEANRHYKYNVSGLSAAHDDAEIKLYYTDNIRDAIPKTKWQLWTGYYAFFGILLGVSLWRIIKVYKSAF